MSWSAAVYLPNDFGNSFFFVEFHRTVNLLSLSVGRMEHKNTQAHISIDNPRAFFNKNMQWLQRCKP